MYLLIAETTTQGSHFPFWAIFSLALGFVFAVSIGSLAWYNSKRPVGWKDKQRPDFLPKVDQAEN